jgi:hypothetical protein
VGENRWSATIGSLEASSRPKRGEKTMSIPAIVKPL